jgi:hypothetical protein
LVKEAVRLLNQNQIMGNRKMAMNLSKAVVWDKDDGEGDAV